jgi:hypothetical protein
MTPKIANFNLPNFLLTPKIANFNLSNYFKSLNILTWTYKLNFFQTLVVTLLEKVLRNEM